MDFVTQPLGGDFGPIVAAQLTITGAGCGAAGVWVVQFGRAFLAESLTHALLPGLAIASVVGLGLVPGALIGIGLAYLANLALAAAPRTSGATATSVAVTSLTAGGALIATGGGAVGLESLLFGDPLATTKSDLVLAAVLLAAIAATLRLLDERFTAVAFDSGGAGALGISTRGVQAALLLLIVAAVAVSANVAGSLPALALLVGPALATGSLSRGIGRSVTAAAAVGAACGLAAVFLSYHADWPAGASVAIAAGGAAASGRIARALRSVGKQTQPEINASRS